MMHPFGCTVSCSNVPSCSQRYLHFSLLERRQLTFAKPREYHMVWIRNLDLHMADNQSPTAQRPTFCQGCTDWLLTIHTWLQPLLFWLNNCKIYCSLLLFLNSGLVLKTFRYRSLAWPHRMMDGVHIKILTGIHQHRRWRDGRLAESEQRRAGHFLLLRPWHRDWNSDACWALL